MEIIGDTMGSLKPVFDACDQNGDGFVKTKDLLRLIQQHTDIASEDIASMIGFLDPNENGSISFDHFCDGVKEFMVANNDHGDFDHDNNNLKDKQTEKDHDDELEADLCSHSTASTNDYNGDFDEESLAEEYLNPGSGFQRNGIYSTYPPKGNLKKKEPPLSQRLMARNVLDESLSETSEYQSDNGGYNGFSEVIEDVSLGPISSTPTMKRKHGKLRRKNNNFMSHSLNTSPHRSYDDFEKAISDNEANLSTLSDKIFRLTSEVTTLQEDNSINLNKHNKMKQDNKTLTERINALEELLEQQKISTDEKVANESRKYNAALAKLERESEERLERLQNKLNEADEEITQLKQVDPMLRRELEICLQEKRNLEEKLENLEYKLSEKDRVIEELDEKLRSERTKFEEERLGHTQEIVEYQSRIDELRNFKKAAESRLPDFVSVAAEKGDLEDQLRALQKENADLVQSRDELKVQLIQQGKCLLEKNTSLADELLTADKEDVLKALREQETLNHRLRAYTDSILMMIMEYHPELLEK
ncbi:rab11 family-interacting protein 3-like [Dendronephthya gigantea]|uniref:rab11 family-interacting protein 3-like n=1 Tax=Dendronephthya gigantea TaxID=151771 RepID=UPI00106BCE26|nr:rab11 family-interacting protein 3-like [Dendronephthya gigantea]